MACARQHPKLGHHEKVRRRTSEVDRFQAEPSSPSRHRLYFPIRENLKVAETKPYLFTIDDELKHAWNAARPSAPEDPHVLC